MPQLLPNALSSLGIPLGSLALGCNACVTFLVCSSRPQKAGVPLLLYLGHRRIS